MLYVHFAVDVIFCSKNIVVLTFHQTDSDVVCFCVVCPLILPLLYIVRGLPRFFLMLRSPFWHCAPLLSKLCRFMILVPQSLPGGAACQSLEKFEACLQYHCNTTEVYGKINVLVDSSMCTL